MKPILKQEKFVTFCVDNGQTIYEDEHGPHWEPESVELLGVTYWKQMETTANYDTHGNLVSSICVNPDDSSTLTSKNDYDDNGVLRRQVKIQSDRDWYEEFIYDERGWLIKTINRDSSTHEVRFENITSNTIEGGLRYARTLREHAGPRPIVECQIFDLDGKLIKSMYDESEPNSYFRCEYDHLGREDAAYSNYGNGEQKTTEYGYGEDTEEWVTKFITDFWMMNRLRQQDWCGMYPKHVNFPTSIVVVLDKVYW